MELIVGLLATATALVLIDLALMAHRAWAKAQVRRAFQARIKRDLARDTLIHDRVRQLPLPEEADDYLLLMAERFEQQASHVHRTSPTQGVTSRGVSRASGQSG